VAEVVKAMMDNWALSLIGTWGIQYTTPVEVAVNSEETKIGYKFDWWDGSSVIFLPKEEGLEVASPPPFERPSGEDMPDYSPTTPVYSNSSTPEPRHSNFSINCQCPTCLLYTYNPGYHGWIDSRSPAPSPEPQPVDDTDNEALDYWIDLRVEEEIDALMGDGNDEDEISPTFLPDTSPWLFNVSGPNTRGATPDVPLDGEPFDVGQPPLSQTSHFDVSNFNLLHPNQIYQVYIWAKCLEFYKPDRIDCVTQEESNEIGIYLGMRRSEARVIRKLTRHLPRNRED
jgi:hypothetical protein